MSIVYTTPHKKLEITFPPTASVVAFVGVPQPDGSMRYEYIAAQFVNNVPAVPPLASVAIDTATRGIELLLKKISLQGDELDTRRLEAQQATQSLRRRMIGQDGQGRKSDPPQSNK